MAAEPIQEPEFDDESDEEDVAEQLAPGSIAAVVSGTDWTTETVVSQLRRGNILLKPRFQRRDAWGRDRKSRFIESLIVGLPIPQIVLAESKQDRGKFIVLDGKQRLLDWPSCSSGDLAKVRTIPIRFLASPYALISRNDHLVTYQRMQPMRLTIMLCATNQYAP